MFRVLNYLFTRNHIVLLLFDWNNVLVVVNYLEGLRFFCLLFRALRSFRVFLSLGSAVLFIIFGNNSAGNLVRLLVKHSLFDSL